MCGARMPALYGEPALRMRAFTLYLLPKVRVLSRRAVLCGILPEPGLSGRDEGPCLSVPDR